MMQWTDRNRFTMSSSGGYKMTNDRQVRTGEAIKESVVCVSTELAVDELVEDGESMAMPNELYKKQCHV